MLRYTVRIPAAGQVRAARVRARQMACVAVALLSLGAPAIRSQSSLGADDQTARAAAVTDARQGLYDRSLNVLARLREHYPEDPALLHDYITVLAWAGRDDQAFNLALPLGPEALPVFVALPVAKSARNLRRFDDAERWYRAILRAEPANTQALLGLLLTQADRGDAAGVGMTITELSELGIDDSEAQLATAYSLRAIGDTFRALEIYDAVLDADPANREALRGKALVLRSMLLPSQALAIGQANPGVLTEEEMARLRSDEVAVRVRLAGRTSQPAPASYAPMDAAIAFLDRQLAETNDPAALVALKRDRIVALVDALRPEEAIAEYEALPAADRSGQAYVQGAVAKAYLQLRRPQDALDAIVGAIALDTANVEYKFLLAYVYMDLERFDDAFELTATLTRDLPLVNTSAGGAVVKVNENGMRAQLLAGVVEAYGDRLASAQRRFESILGGAPNNADARHELANVYRWRGWLDRSLDEYRQVVTSDPALLSARLGQGHAQIDAREYAQVDALVTELRAGHGREPAAQSLIDRWELHNKRELLVTGSTIRSSGSTFGSNAHTLDARGYSAPINYRYRAFAHAYEGEASFPEGDADRSRLGGGVQYRAGRWTASGELSTGSGSDGLGAAGTVDWRVSDSWTIGGAIELNAYGTQLRAHRAGIDADGLSASASFAVDESVGMTLGLGLYDYSDGNSQTTAYAEGHYRLLNKPRSKLDVIGSLSTTHSTTDLVPYFSPRQADMLLAGLEHELRLFRRYSRSVTQRIRLSSGRYDQSTTPGGDIWRFGYELDWRLNDGLSLAVGAERRSDFYDALREHSTYGLLAVNARF